MTTVNSYKDLVNDLAIGHENSISFITVIRIFNSIGFSKSRFAFPSIGTIAWLNLILGGDEQTSISSYVLAIPGTWYTLAKVTSKYSSAV